MSRNPIALILLMGLATLIAFVVFQISSILTKSAIPAPTQRQMETLDPNLDKSLIDALKKASESATPK
jgi:hypothetical protein